MRVIVSPKARADLKAYATYLRWDNPALSDRFLQAARSAFRAIGEHPRAGRPRAFEGSTFTGMRSISLPGFRNHLVFYQVIDKRVRIVRVLHGAMDADAVFGQPRRSSRGP